MWSVVVVVLVTLAPAVAAQEPPPPGPAPAPSTTLAPAATTVPAPAPPAVAPTTTLVPPPAPEAAGPEASRNVATPAQWRQALTDLSAVTTGTNTITITADLTFNGSVEPTYTGTRPLVVEGQDHTADMGLNSGFLTMDTTARVTIRDLDVVNAYALPDDGGCGGAIRSSGAVVIERSYLVNNAASAHGGAVCTTGNLTVTDSAMDANTAYAGHPVPGDAVAGGAISVGGDLTIRRSTFVSNNSWGILGGGAVWAHGGTVTIEGSTFSTNHALTESVAGGALRLDGDGAATITDSELGGNTTEGGAGGAIHAGPDVDLTVTGGILTGNRIQNTPAPGLSTGGGAIQAEAPVTIDGTQIRNNEARNARGGALNLLEGGVIRDAVVFGNSTTGTLMGAGGAVHSDGALTVRRTEFEANTTAAASGSGGAIAVADALVRDSTFEDDEVTGAGADGGSIHVLTQTTLADEVTVERSIFTGSSAADDGGAIAVSTFGGGGSLVLRDSAVWSTSSGGDGGALAGALVDVQNTSITRSEAGGRGGAVWAEPYAGLTSVSLAENTAAGNGEHLATVADGITQFRATVFAAPTSGVSCHWGAGANSVSSGYSVDTDDTCRLISPHDLTDVADPGLGRPHRVGRGVAPVPLAGSLLVDAIPLDQCAFDHDQQGVARPFGATCDIGAMEQLFPTSPLTDIPPWITDAGRWITWDGNVPQIMAGFDDDTFRADDPITRAQVVRLLYNLAEAPDVSGFPAHPFTDVPPWVEDAVRWAYEENVMEGFDDGTFRPNDPITRAQVVRMLHRFAGEPPVVGIDPHPFTDVPPWVDGAVTWAADTDLPLPIFSGIGPTTFVPNDDITRGQVARSVYRLSLTPDAWLDPDAASGQVIFQSNLF